MKVLLQRVREADVKVNDQCIGAIGQGLLLLVGIEKDDDATKMARMAQRLAGYRVFADTDGRMNASVADIGGALLVVSQFTLAANTQKGRRPSFSSAAPPDVAEKRFEEFLTALRQTRVTVETGQFGADMQVSLVNDGPVTFLLEM